MSDLTWYSRLSIWSGAAVLLLESFTRHGLGAVTVLATFACALGLLGFAGGLVWDAHPRLPAQDTAGPTADERVAIEPIVEAAPIPPTAPAAADSVGAVSPAAPIAPPADADTAALAQRSQSARGATAQEVLEGSALAGLPCLVCQEPLRSGQTAARCRTCTGPHHATCWMGNHFHCGREGCAGFGGLHAPDDDAEIPFGSPSKP